MSINIDANEDKGLLEVTYSPETVTPKDLAEQRRIVSDTLSETGIRKVLVNASSLASFPSIIPTLSHNERVAANEILRNTKFAVVCSSLGQNEQDLETTGVNRGVRIKCFTTRENALSWLIE